MLMPKRVKRRKQFRGTMRGKATRTKVTESLTANTALSQRNPAGLQAIRSKRRVSQ